MPDLLVDSHIIAAFRNRTNIIDAISELIDNGGDAKADLFEIAIGKTLITATDNGRGLRDLNTLFKLGGSLSADVKDAIGRYGIGAKEAILYFGSVATVESVYAGKYRAHRVNWDEIEALGTPKPHSGRTLPLRHAPEPIQNGGTRITIERLTVGRPRIYPEIVIKRLSHRYRPGIRKGKKYIIIFNGERYELASDAEKLGLWANEREIMGEAVERPFTLRFTDLKEYDQNISGLHIGFGNRFIEHLDRLNGKTLPPIFYAEIMLSSKWKECLSANKTFVTQHRDELLAEAERLLHDWITELETFADEARIEKLNLLLQKHTAEIFIFKPGGKGSGQAKNISVTDRHDGDGPVNPQPHKDENEVRDGDDGSKEKRKRRPSGLRFQRNDKLGNLPFEIATDLDKNQITVLLNGSIPAIDNAYRVPYKIPALWPLIASAFSGWVRDNILSIDEFIPNFLDMLHGLGYPIDREKPTDTELYVLTWMMRQHPPSAKGIEDAERTRRAQS
jgi:hypothetical protein